MESLESSEFKKRGSSYRKCIYFSWNNTVLRRDNPFSMIVCEYDLLDSVSALITSCCQLEYIIKYKHVRSTMPLQCVYKIAESDYWLGHVCPSVHMEQLGCHWMDFDEIWY